MTGSIVTAALNKVYNRGSKDARDFADMAQSFLQEVCDYKHPEAPSDPYEDEKRAFPEHSYYEYDTDSGHGTMILFSIVSNVINSPEWENHPRNAPCIVRNIHPGTMKRTPALSLNTQGRQNYRHIPTGRILSVNAGSYSIRVNLYHEDDEETADNFLTELFFTPNPYEGRVVKLDDMGIPSVLHLEEDPTLSDYEPEVEDAISWLTSVTDQEIRNELISRGLSTRAGLILAGPPGSGKTTLVRRTAQKLQGEVTTVYPAPGCSLEAFMGFANMFDVVLVVLEDVDSFFEGRDSAKFSQFLNYVDGLDNEQTVMFLATSNDTSEFDAAVKRPGRLERQVVISDVNPNAVPDMVQKRLPGVENVSEVVDIIMEKCSDGVVTPAVVDSLARAIVMSRVNNSDVVKYAKEVWEPSFEGESFV